MVQTAVVEVPCTILPWSSSRIPIRPLMGEVILQSAVIKVHLCRFNISRVVLHKRSIFVYLKPLRALRLKRKLHRQNNQRLFLPLPVKK
jgi:hypothetical protein